MPSITLKNIPDPLHRRLVESARSHHRSLSKEIVVALEHYVQQSATDKTELLARIRAVRDRYPSAISAADIEEWKAVGRP